MCQRNPITCMRTRFPVLLLVLSSIVIAGCIQLPGLHILGNTPDPLIGQWIGGEPPASDLHVILFENHTYYSRSFYLGQTDKTGSGSWSRDESGSFLMLSVSGENTSWAYDPGDDSIYQTALPLKKYYRFRG
jgi:hypothetical protein